MLDYNKLSKIISVYQNHVKLNFLSDFQYVYRL